MKQRPSTLALRAAGILLVLAGGLSCGGSSSTSTPVVPNQKPTLLFTAAPTSAVQYHRVTFGFIASDPDGGTPTVTVNGNAAPGSTYVFSSDTPGTQILQFRVTDGKDSVTYPLAITVVSNTGPTLTQEAISLGDGASTSLPLPTKDADNDSLAWAVKASNLPAGAIAISPAGTSLEVNSAGVQPNSYTVTLTATESGGTLTRSIATDLPLAVIVTNLPPVVEDAAYSTTAPTNQDVVATFRSGENLPPPLGWAKAFESGTGKYAYTRTYAANTTESVSFLDGFGGRTDKGVSISWIDKTPPAVLTFEAAAITQTSVDLHVVANESGKGYLWLPGTIPVTTPATTEVVQNATQDGSILTLVQNQLVNHPRTGLQASTAYAAFLVAEDAVGNRSAVRRLELRTQGYGPVTISGNAAQGDVQISYDGGSTGTDGQGNYSFTVAYGWSGTVTPSLPGYLFSPLSRQYVNLTSNQTGQNFQATPATVTISGTTNWPGVLLFYTGGSMSSDGSGFYTITVPYGWSGTVTPSLQGYAFNPTQRDYSNVVTNLTGQNFTVVPQ